MVAPPDINGTDDCTQSDTDNSVSFVRCMITTE